MSEAPRPVPVVPAVGATSPVGSTEVANDGAWAKVGLERWLPGTSFVKATYEFGGRVALPASGVSESMQDAPAVVVAPTGIFFEGRPIAKIVGGEIAREDRDRDNEYLITGLGEPLKRGLAAVEQAAKQGGEEDPWLLVTLFADAGTPFGVIVALLFTSGKAGAFGYQLAVTPTGAAPKYGSPMLFLSPPKYAVAGEDPPARPEKLQLVMMVSRTDVRVGKHVPSAKEKSAWLERVPVGEDRGPAMRRISEIARAAMDEEKWAPEDGPVVLVGAERDVPLGLLVEAMNAAAGADCVMTDMLELTPHRCMFVSRVVHGGSPAPPELQGQ